MGTQELAVMKGEMALSPKEVFAQIQIIQQLMKDGMKEGEHWGKIPGCGEKPALLKPGAEKLGLMFRLAAKYEIQETNLPNGHLDVKTKCSLYHISTGQFWGEGIGSCSTMESKYRYRSGVGASTGVVVKKEYWDLKRVGKYKEAQEIIGAGYTTAKIDPVTGLPDKAGTWMIVEKIDRVENPDIADTYNTVRKISKKRSYVDAMLSATAASDIFTQDLEDFAPDTLPAKAEPVKEAVEPQKTGLESPQEAEKGPDLITHEEQLEIVRLVKEKGIHHNTIKKALREEFGVEGTAKITKEMYPKVVEWVIRNESSTVGA